MKISISDRRIHNIVKKVCEPMDVLKFHDSVRVENKDAYWAFMQPISFTHGDGESLIDKGKQSSKTARDISSEKYDLRVHFHLDPAFPTQGMVIISGK